MLVVEGVSCTGKTTLCSFLSREYGFSIVPEGARYLERWLGKPREQIMRIPESVEEERRNQDLLFKAEEEKVEEALSLLEGGKEVVLDKSALSILASAYAFERKEGVFGDLNYAKRKLASLLRRYGHRFDGVDVKIAVLTLDHGKRVRRSKSRGSPLSPVWVDEDVTSLQQRFFVNAIELGLAKGRVFSGEDRSVVEDVCSYYEEED